MIAPRIMLQLRAGERPYDVPDMRGLLTCGHWGEWTFAASSTWDFPMDEQHCPTCSTLKYFVIPLQCALMNEEPVEAEEVPHA